jgi:hypothetical protein
MLQDCCRAAATVVPQAVRFAAKVRAGHTVALPGQHGSAALALPDAMGCRVTVIAAGRSTHCRQHLWKPCTECSCCAASIASSCAVPGEARPSIGSYSLWHSCRSCGPGDQPGQQPTTAEDAAAAPMHGLRCYAICGSLKPPPWQYVQQAEEGLEAGGLPGQHTQCQGML